MNGDGVGLGGSFARAGCGFFRAGAAEALPPAPLPPLLLLPNELADLLGGLIAP
jgi:hypothetical protein